MSAFDHARTILSWFEHIADPKEIPPRWMWHLDWELEIWWREREADRDTGSGRAHPDPKEPSSRQQQQPPMMVNTLHPRNRR